VLLFISASLSLSLLDLPELLSVGEGSLPLCLGCFLTSGELECLPCLLGGEAGLSLGLVLGGVLDFLTGEGLSLLPCLLVGGEADLSLGLLLGGVLDLLLTGEGDLSCLLTGGEGDLSFLPCLLGGEADLSLGLLEGGG